MKKYKIEKLRNKLFTAINKLNFEEVKRCIVKARTQGVKNEIINDKQYGMAPIHFATYRGSPKILQFLLNNGADINAVSDACLVPSTFIVVKHDTSKVVFSCIHSDTSFQGMQNFTALHLALYHCRLDVAKVLVENGIDTSIRSANGKMAFEVIPDYENLCSNGCDIQKISLALLKFHKNNCKALLTSAKTDAKVELEAGGTTDAASNTANPFSASIRENIKIGLEVSNTTDLASSKVNSSFTLTKADFKETSSITSGAVTPSSFINRIFSWITTVAFDRSIPALPSTYQPVAEVYSQTDHLNGVALLTAVTISKLTGKQCLRPLDNSPLTTEKIRERELNTMAKNVEVALDKCKKLYQCPGSSLSNLTISKGVNQKSL